MENPYIEPCCYEKWLGILIEEMKGNGGSSCFFTNSDWNESQLITYLCNRFPKSELFVTFVQIEQNTADTLRKLMGCTTVDKESKQNVPLVRHLYVLMKGTPYNRKVVYDALNNVEDGRITVCEDRIGFRSVMVMQEDGKGCLMQGSLNQFNGDDTQMINAVINKDVITSVKVVFRAKSRVKEISNWKEKYNHGTGY
ncbi:MAG: hypothetical protein ACI36Z_01410 [Alloprevotella sp.]